MADLKQMTVQALRDLARRALGPGFSKYKTKSDLIAALKEAEKRVAGAAQKAAASVKGAAGRAATAAGKTVEPAARRGLEKPAAQGETAREKSPARAKERPREASQEKTRERAPAKLQEKARDRRPVPAAPAREAGRAARPAAAGTRAPEEEAELQPDPEGHFVARILGEEAAREAPHPMTESAVDARRGKRTLRRVAPEAGGAPAYEERLGELPWSYGDDAFVALPRDPSTLFFYWDHAQETLRRAWEGMEGGRPQLWVFARSPMGGDWERIAVVDFALESRSYYVHDLQPGRLYRGEIHIVGGGGRERLLASPSNAVQLPPVGPSPIVDDRFMRIPWGESLVKILLEARPGSPFSEEVRAQLARLSDWSRFSGTFGGGSAGGMGGRPSSPTGGPSSPRGPFGGEGR